MAPKHPPKPHSQESSKDTPPKASKVSSKDSGAKSSSNLTKAAESETSRTTNLFKRLSQKGLVPNASAVSGASSANATAGASGSKNTVTNKSEEKTSEPVGSSGSKDIKQVDNSEKLEKNDTKPNTGNSTPTQKEEDLEVHRRGSAALERRVSFFSSPQKSSSINKETNAVNGTNHNESSSHPGSPTVNIVDVIPEVVYAEFENRMRKLIVELLEPSIQRSTQFEQQMLATHKEVDGLKEELNNVKETTRAAVRASDNLQAVVADVRRQEEFRRLF